MDSFDKLYKLSCKPEAYRDLTWETEFLELIASSKLQIPQPDTEMGPDGFPYLFAKISKEGTESFSDLLKWLASRGIGLAINAHKQMPDYIFTYGMIWSFLTTGKFFEARDETLTEVSYSEDKQLYAGDPTEAFLPPPVRAVLIEYFKNLNILNPKITMLSNDQKTFDLCFSIESLNSPEEKEHNKFLEALSWFFPPHYGLALVSESTIPNFKALKLDNSPVS